MYGNTSEQLNSGFLYTRGNLDLITGGFAD